MQSLSFQLSRPQSSSYKSGHYHHQLQFEDDLTRSNTANSVAASTISESGSARTASTLGSPKSFSAHHFIQWQVKTESHLKEKEGKLQASLSITNRLNDELLKIRYNNEAISSQTKYLEQEQVSLHQTLEKVKTEVLKLTEQLKKVKFGANKFTLFKDGVQLSETERCKDVDVLTSRIGQLKMSFDVKIGRVSTSISSHQHELKTVQDALDVNRRSKLTDTENLGSSLRKTKEDSESILARKDVLKKKTTILKESVDSLEKKAKFDSEKIVTRTEENFETESNFNKESLKLDQEETDFSSKSENFVQELSKLEKSTQKIVTDLELSQEEVTYFKNLLSEQLTSNKARSEEESNFQLVLSKNEKLVEDLNVSLENVDKLKNEVVCLKNVLDKTESQRSDIAGKLKKLVEVDNLKDNLEAENFNLCQEIHKLEALVNSRSTEIADLKDVIKRKDASSQTKEADLMALCKGNKNLKIQKDDMDGEEKKLNSRSSKLISRRKEMTNEINLVKGNDLELSEKELKIEVSNFIKLLDDKKRLLNDQEVEIIKLKDKRKELKASIKTKHDLIKTFDDKLTSSKDSSRDTSGSDKELQKQLQNLRTKLRKHEKEISKMNGQIDQRKQTESNLKEELNKAEKEENKINEIIGNLGAEVEELKSCLTSLEAKVDQGRSMENQSKLDFEQIKKLEKSVSSSKRSLTSALKSHEKMMKQFDKNSKSLESLKSEVSQIDEKLEHNQSVKESLNKEMISMEMELSNVSSMGNGLSQSNLRVSQSVIDQLEDHKSKLSSDHKLMVREYEGTLICKERENEKSFKDLKDDIEKLNKNLESSSNKLEILKMEFDKVDEDEDPNDEASKVLKQVEDAKSSLTALETHLKERREEGCKLELQLENVKEYESPNPSGRFFKTPRTQGMPSYKSPIMPSPRKKMASGSNVKTPPATPKRSPLLASGRSIPSTPMATPMRSFLAAPRVSPAKSDNFRLSSSSRRNSGEKPSMTVYDIMSMSESSQN